MSSPTDTPAWHSLQSHCAQFKQADFHLTQLFDTATSRFDTFSLTHDNLLVDYSKNLLNEQTLELLIALAEQQHVPAAIAAMFAGDKINTSEQRAALHIALREPPQSSRFPEVQATLKGMAAFVDGIQSGAWRGFSNQPITTIVNLGVGGSDLGPALLVNALHHHSTSNISVRFISNIDPVHTAAILQQLNPATTLFIVASKSFSTLETIHNAHTARKWLVATAGNEAAVSKHFVAVTANVAAAADFGISAEQVFPIWDWVGGRFSVWSAIGLPIALALGMDKFRALLSGAHSMDRHFQSAPLRQNMPVISALLAIWYRGFFAAHSSAVMPYSASLNLLPAYLQQLSMESLGKSVDLQHDAITLPTGEPIWGAEGTNAQHACFQLLHQGSEFIPVDFIAVANPATGSDPIAHQHLLANCFSQSLALMRGQTDSKSPFRHMPGNRPSTTILLSELSPFNLGSLLALYEHKVYVQSVVWNINAFDQWGVELGKQLSGEIVNAIKNPDTVQGLDDSTRHLIARIRDWTRK